MKKVITYVALTFLLSSAGYYLIINSKALGLSRPSTETGPMSKYMIGESGIVLTVIFIGLAWVFLSQRGRLPAGIRSK